MRIFRHIIIDLFALLVTLGVPFLYYYDLPAHLRGQDVDAVSRASMELPEQPSGDFVVYVNRALHAGTLEQWDLFFAGEDAGVIMDDVTCMVMEGDPTGRQLAERYQARLAEHQMTVSQGQAVLVASRLECGRYDVVVLSKEMAEAMAVSTEAGAYGAQVTAVEGDGA